MARPRSTLALFVLAVASCTLDWSCDSEGKDDDPAPNLGSDQVPCNEGNPTFLVWRGVGESSSDVSVHVRPTAQCRFKLIGTRGGERVEGEESAHALTETWDNVQRLELACLGNERELKECCRYRIVAIQ